MKKLLCIGLLALAVGLLLCGAALAESKAEYYQQIDAGLDSLQSALASGDSNAANAALTQVRNAVYAGASYLSQIGEYNSNTMQIVSSASEAINHKSDDYEYYLDQARAYNMQVFGNSAVQTAYTVALTASPAGAGTVTGAGTYADGETVTISASANGGYRFDHWIFGDGSTNDEVPFHFIIHENRTIEAVFVEDASNVSSYTLEMPESVTISPNAVTTAFTVKVSALDLRPNASGITPPGLRLKINAATLVNQADPDKTIPFKMSLHDSTLGTVDTTYYQFDSAQSMLTYIVITDSQWAAAAPGVYTGAMTYQPFYLYPNRDVEWLETIKSIPVTLTIPAQATTYAVTVNNGTGGGEYAEGESVAIAANAAPEGQRFAGWTGADGLTFTSGSAATAEAAFTMPANAVTLTATYEDIRYPIATDGTAAALHEVGWLDWQPAAEAAEGEALSLELVDGAAPAEGYYFTGEFAVNGVSLGVVYDKNGLFSRPVTELTMPAGAISIAAVQVPRETVALDFAQGAALVMPYMALVQLRNGEDTAALFTVDDDWNEFIDLDGSGAPDIAVAEPDDGTTTDYTLTLLPGHDAVGGFAFSFAGPTDRYGAIAFALPAPAFGAPDFTLPEDVEAIGDGAFEGVAATVVEIPGGCVSIGDYAFADCPNLTQIRIPASVTAIGADIFDGCAHTVFVFGAEGSAAQTWCRDRDDCVFVEEAGE